MESISLSQLRRMRQFAEFSHVWRSFKVDFSAYRAALENGEMWAAHGVGASSLTGEMPGTAVLLGKTTLFGLK